jgi:CSLREA domain-containing protein
MDLHGILRCYWWEHPKEEDAMTATTNPKLGLAALVLCALLCGTAAPAPANVYIVRNTADSNDGTCDGHCSLREAIVAANAHPGYDYVTVPAGTYVLTIPGAYEDACATGDLDVTDSVFISGAGPATTVVDAVGLEDAGARDRVIHANAPGGQVVLSGLTLTGAFPAGSGGGALNEAGHLMLSNVVVRDNRAEIYGGGVSSEGAALTVKDGSVIADNLAFNGGGLIGSDVTVTASTVSGNQAHTGAGIYVSSGGTLTVSGSTLAYNRISELDGGAIFANNAQVELTNSTVVGNFAANGAGYYAEHGSLTLDGVTFSGNGVSWETYSTVLVSWGDVAFTNTLIAGWCAVNQATHSSNGGNLESPGNTCTLTHAGDHVNVADAMLAPLAPYGGVTRTLLPRLGSPAVGGGSNAHCLAEDQRGELRSDGSCDVGAVERQVAEQDPLFVDGFESGDDGLWSASSP